MVLRLYVKFYDEFHLFMIISQIQIVFQVLYSPRNQSIWIPSVQELSNDLKHLNMEMVQQQK